MPPKALIKNKILFPIKTLEILKKNPPPKYPLQLKLKIINKNNIEKIKKNNKNFFSFNTEDNSDQLFFKFEIKNGARQTKIIDNTTKIEDLKSV